MRVLVYVCLWRCVDEKRLVVVVDLVCSVLVAYQKAKDKIHL